MDKSYSGTGFFQRHHADPPGPFNPNFKPDAKDRYATVTASMVADNFYATHSREECKAEWGRRYDALSPNEAPASESIDRASNSGKLEFQLSENILEVVETLHSANGTRRRHWYYDIENWTVSSFGRKGDTVDRPMTDGAIEWVKKHYLPHVEVNRPVSPKIQLG